MILLCTIFPFPFVSLASSHVAFIACHHPPFCHLISSTRTISEPPPLSSHPSLHRISFPSPFSRDIPLHRPHSFWKNLFFLRHTSATLFSPDYISPLPSLTTPARGLGEFSSLPARFHLYSRDIYSVVCWRP